VGTVRQAKSKGKRMIRNFKVLGVAFMAVLALSAVVASAASAQNGRITSTGKVTLVGTENTPSKLTAFGLTVECPGSTYTGHKYNVTPHTFIENGAETATLSPKYKEPCKNNFAASTVDLNGCDYVVHLGATTGVADTYAVTYDIVCPVGKDITVTNWLAAAEHTEGKEACVLHIAPQTGLKGGTVKDTTAGDLELKGPVTGIKVVETKDALHPLLCPAKEGTGELDIDATVKGNNEAGANTAISLSHL
jgi:hypothetical protein